MQTTENKLAVQIVDALMTAGDGKPGTRLVVWDDTNGYMPDRGGWGRDSAVREVELLLIRAKESPDA